MRTLPLPALFLAASIAWAAPAPFPRRPAPPPKTPPVECVMLWDACQYTATFAPDGSYRCCGWEGRWALAWPTLYLWERPPGEDRPHDRYEIRLDERWRGTFTHGRDGTFELRPAR